ncbi:MAG: glycosyltransferase, partial [Steroidobacteraceae bacterium]
MTDSFGARVDISVIIPVGQRHAADILALYADYKTGLEALGSTYEVIVVLDGPRPQLAADVQRLLSSGEPISVISLTRRFGEATALVAGFKRAGGGIILTLPAYHQVHGKEIGKLVRALGVTDVAIGRRWPRVGGRFEIMRRDAFHRVLASITGQRFHDLGCGA